MERVVALAVVALHAGEVLVGRRNQVGARHAFAGRDRRRERRTRRSQRFDALRGHRVALEDLLDLGDAAVGDLEPQRHECRRALRGIGVVFDNGRDERDLAGLRVCDWQAIGAYRLHALPEAFAER